MNHPNPKIPHLSLQSPAQSWQQALELVASGLSAQPWNPPRWVVADGRHRRAAELDLLAALDSQAISTQGICTLASLAGDVLQQPVQFVLASPAAITLALEEIFSGEADPSYSASRDKPGFAPSFWFALQDAESRGHFPDFSFPDAEGKRPPHEFHQLQRLLHQKLQRRNLCTPGAFLRRAIEALQQTRSSPFDVPLFIGPLLHTSVLDREFIAALADSGLSINLIPAAGQSPAAMLPRRYQHTVKLDSPPSQPEWPARFRLIRPKNPEEEFDVIFALMADWVASGRYGYRDFRIVHPMAVEELPRLQFAARRYHIPLKTDLESALAQSPAVGLLQKLLGLFSYGWRRADLLELLRSRLFHEAQPESSACGRRILELPPAPKSSGQFWTQIASQAGFGVVAAKLRRFQLLDEQSAGLQNGLSFSVWLSQLVRLLEEDFALETSDVYRAGAFAALDRMIQDLARTDLKADRGKFIELTVQAINMSRYHIKPPALEAVELISGAREDHLDAAVLFYPALTSRVPSPDRSSPFWTGDQKGGYADKQRLFSLQLSRGREEIILSCPQYDDSGDALSLSPFLNSLPDLESATQRGAELLGQARSWHPAILSDAHPVDSADGRAPLRPPKLIREQSLAMTRVKSLRWSSTKLENAIQCLYKHFAADILRLQALDDGSERGITPKLLGSLAHQALRQYVAATMSAQTFDLAGWMEEKVQAAIAQIEPHLEFDRSRAELALSLRQFVQLGWQSLLEGFSPQESTLEFSFGRRGSAKPPLLLDSPLGQLQIEGRIDRLDVCDNRAAIIEYKYKKSSREKQDDFFQDVRKGNQPQLPLYWLVARDILGLQPVALIQIYLRSAQIRALHLPEVPAFPEGTQAQQLSAEEAEKMLKNVIALLQEKAGATASGIITPFPDDFERCGPGNCPFADLCRFRGKPWRRE